MINDTESERTAKEDRMEKQVKQQAHGGVSFDQLIAAAVEIGASVTMALLEKDIPAEVRLSFAGKTFIARLEPLVQ